MTTRKRLAILGGDLRQIALANALTARGYSVFVWGLGRCETRLKVSQICKTWQDAIRDADAVILPLPASQDGVRLNCPLESSDLFVRMTALIDSIPPDTCLLGGRLTETVLELAATHGLRTVDYFSSETLQLRNAVPTAEGAIAIAMRELPVTLDGSVAAVLGYGRIGKLLADKLRALGVDVTVLARRREALAEAKTHHHRTESISPLCLPEGCRVVFNTVPQWILNAEALASVPDDCVLIDLASAPGGIDLGAAQARGLRCVWGTALPGKCTPETAGKILALTVCELLEDPSSPLA